MLNGLVQQIQAQQKSFKRLIAHVQVVPLRFEAEINPGYSPDLATQSRILLESQLMINPSCILDSSVFAMPLSCKPYARDPSYTWIVSRCFENEFTLRRHAPKIACIL